MKKRQKKRVRGPLPPINPFGNYHFLFDNRRNRTEEPGTATRVWLSNDGDSVSAAARQVVEIEAIHSALVERDSERRYGGTPDGQVQTSRRRPRNDASERCRRREATRTDASSGRLQAAARRDFIVEDTKQQQTNRHSDPRREDRHIAAEGPKDVRSKRRPEEVGTPPTPDTADTRAALSRRQRPTSQGGRRIREPPPPRRSLRHAARRLRLRSTRARDRYRTGRQVPGPFVEEARGAEEPRNRRTTGKGGWTVGYRGLLFLWQKYIKKKTRSFKCVYCSCKGNTDTREMQAAALEEWE
ncbi:uncharacterized protein LOC113127594 [Mastacembelus armatus]|uniref:uncharacterized protein LOC113127594 n=1 Tax=Mastacembelus armatus TaxID=205130 RepID=UPI000E464FDA|nr:uncharacterized protein LOC113127594 [Mastacembelus armatus]